MIAFARIFQASEGDKDNIDEVLDSMVPDDAPAPPSTPQRPTRPRSPPPPTPSASPNGPSEKKGEVTPTRFDIFRKILHPEESQADSPFKSRIRTKTSPPKSRVFEEANIGILTRASAFSHVDPTLGGQHKSARAAKGAEAEENAPPMKATKAMKGPPKGLKRPAAADERAKEEGPTPRAKAAKETPTPPKEDRLLLICPLKYIIHVFLIFPL